MSQSLREDVIEQLTPFLPDPKPNGELPEARTLSLLFPTPDVDGNQEKWDLIKKNLLSALDNEDLAPKAQREAVSGIVTSLSRSDLPPGGFAVFSDGENTRYFALQRRPEPQLSFDSAPLTAAVLADAQESRRFWLAALDVEDPRLFQVTDGVIEDRTPSEVMTLSEQMKITEPMGAVIWHSSGSVKRSGAPAKFHALGSATEDVKKDDIQNVLTAFGNQIADRVKDQDTLIIAGGPARCGHFRETFSHQSLLDREIHAAGEGLDQDELLSKAYAILSEEAEAGIKDELDNLDLSDPIRGINDIRTASLRGQIETLIISPERLGLTEGEDELMDVSSAPNQGLMDRSVAMAYTLKNGGSLILSAEASKDGAVASKRFG
ncbi:hypothetical protein HK107_04565 [Parvularcula sp. ZS-1/3]|uniref:Uncharacterized protein n=1 Tax=Parvularcula mediterranea TaxID=2732508 RepID=A0A7Y3W4V3_9PROT|nr:hypothetical protein [Parvularcula mediterranea]NNU15591.1 hypothetical protein [Parvularcula mediterranea]